MKKNVQLYTAAQLGLCCVKTECFNPRILENGDFVYSTDTGKVTMTANEVAYELNMPLWEVVSVDADGEDEYALLLFEN